VHVEDICSAHLAAESTTSPGSARYYNLGTGKGYSVREVIESARRVTGRDIPVEIGPRRAGDPPVLEASANLARADLGWNPEIPALDDIVATAWKWFRSHPHGYA
jgi:UDP-glucose 4-epimerase